MTEKTTKKQQEFFCCLWILIYLFIFTDVAIHVLFDHSHYAYSYNFTLVRQKVKVVLSITEWSVTVQDADSSEVCVAESPAHKARENAPFPWYVHQLADKR